MDGREFYDRVAEHPDLEWLGSQKENQEERLPRRHGDTEAHGERRDTLRGTTEREPSVAVSSSSPCLRASSEAGGGPSPVVFVRCDRACAKPGTGQVFEVPVRTILDTDWEVLEEVLTGRRPPVVLTHMTRIVGYYSKTKDWNSSKLAELRDRHRGRESYRVPERTRG